MAEKACLILLAALTLWLSGCADPLHHLNSMNPYVRRQWREDEEYLTSLHTKLEELQTVRDQAGSMSPAEQQQWAGTLNQLIVDEPVARLRADMVRTMAKFPPQLVDQGMRAATKDGSAAVRLAACEAWTTRNDEGALMALSEMLGSDTDLDVRLAAARGLGSFQDPRAVQALAVALEDSDPAIQYRAMESLRTASTADYGNDIVAWREYVQGGQPIVDQPSIVRRLQRLF